MSIQNSPLLEEYKTELKKVWGKDQKMIDWCVSQAQSIIKLSTGQLFVTDKPRIETEFCFGYSSCGQGPTFDECNDTIDDFRDNKEKYFLDVNLSPFESYINQLDSDTVLKPFLVSKYYEEKGANIAVVTFMSDFDSDFTLQQCTPLSDKDKLAIKDIYLADKVAMEKRCRTYLKRFGTKKLRYWRYWIDE